MKNQYKIRWEVGDILDMCYFWAEANLIKAYQSEFYQKRP